MVKDKKKKKNKKGKNAASSTVKTLKALSENRLVADVVAAALVATASALKDSKKAQRLAADAGDELTKLSKAGAKRGGVLWDMALQIGRESLEALAGAPAPKSRPSKTKAKPSASESKPAARKSPAKRSSSARKAVAQRKSEKRSK